MPKNENEKLIELILEDIKEMKQDIKTLLSFKYKLIGMATLSSFIISVAIAVIMK